MAFFNKKLPRYRDVEPTFEALNFPTKFVEVHNSSFNGGNFDITDLNDKLTPKKAMAIAAVYSCVDLISSMIAGLPVQVFRKTETGSERISGHPIETLLNRTPSPGVNAFVHKQYLITSYLLRGEGFCLVDRASNYSSQAEKLTLVHPEDVTIDLSTGYPVYIVKSSDGKSKAYNYSDVIHFPGQDFDISTFRSRSIIDSALNTTGKLAINSEKFTAGFFKNGMSSRPVLEFPEGMHDTSILRDKIANELIAHNTGSENSFKPFMVTKGVSVKSLTISPQDAQLLELKEQNSDTISKMFGIHPSLLGSKNASVIGSSQEQVMIGFITLCLMRHIPKFEAEINDKLLNDDEYVKFNVSSLLRGDMMSQEQAYSLALGGASKGSGSMTINEVRRKKDLPPIEGGDVVFMQTEQKAAGFNQ